MVRNHRCSVGICCALAPVLAEPLAAQPGVPTPPLFSQLLPNVPGQRIRVDRLTLRDASIPPHRHAGSVYIHVLEGSALLPVEGELARVVTAGESFFEPARALHSQAKSAVPGKVAIVLAVTIAPDGAPGATFETNQGVHP